MPSLTTSLPTKEAAEEYAEAGRVVFPVGPDKRPWERWRDLVPGPRHVLQVRCWWRKWPQANIGLRTGDGLVVLDVDPRHGGETDPAWPQTRTAETRSGGWHLYYSSDRSVPCSVSKVARGVDIRGQGGFVVAPPSPGWGWLNDLAIAPLPALGAAVTPRHAGGDWAPSAAWRPFEVLEVVPSGGRNDYLARLAGWLLRQGESEFDAEDLLHAYNEAACRPPLEPDEVAGIMASIARFHRPHGSRAGQ